MDEIHFIMGQMPTALFVLVVTIPLAMSVGAVILGWEARNLARERQQQSPSNTRSPQSDALGAAITVAIVPLAFALLMLWARFG